MRKIILKGKTVLVTGAAHGIGEAIALELAYEKCKLLLVDYDRKKLEDTAKKIRTLGIEPILYICNLANAKEREHLHSFTLRNNLKIDALVNNVSVGHWAMFIDTPEDKYEEIINLNIKCTTHLTKIFLSSMIERNEGHIVNLSSTAAFIGGPHIACYSATKAYIHSFSESLSMELNKTGVNVLAVCVGATETHFWEYSGMIGTTYEKTICKMPAKEVAQKTIFAMKAGKSDVTIGLKNKLARMLVKLTPREWTKSLALWRFDK